MLATGPAAHTVTAAPVERQIMSWSGAAAWVFLPRKTARGNRRLGSDTSQKAIPKYKREDG